MVARLWTFGGHISLNQRDLVDDLLAEPELKTAEVLQHHCVDDHHWIESHRS